MYYTEDDINNALTVLEEYAKSIPSPSPAQLSIGTYITELRDMLNVWDTVEFEFDVLVRHRGTARVKRNDHSLEEFVDTMNFDVEALDESTNYGVESWEVWDTVVESYNTTEGI